MGLFRKRSRGPSADDHAAAEDVFEARIKQFAQRAEEFAQSQTEPDGPAPRGALDFSRASLEVIDSILEQARQYPEVVAMANDFGVDYAIYVGEVARREFGGRYVQGNDEDNPFWLVIGHDVQVGVGVFGKVKGRIVNGPEDSIPFFYDGIASAIVRGHDVTLI